MDTLRVGIIGLGNMGSAHAACIAEGKVNGMTLASACETDSQRLAHFSERYPAVQTYTDYRVMIAEKQIDAVVIAVPHPLHSVIAMEALEQGLHVLLEKPVDISISKAAALNEAAAKSGRIFAIMFNQRTNPLFRKAREIMKSGQLGELKRTVWIVTNWYRTQNYYNSGDWRATWAGEGGGVLLNQAPHNLDPWQWICGMPASVRAFCDIAKYHDIEVEDDATILTRYENGATGLFITSTGEYPGTNRLEISGSLGKLVLENGLLKWWKLAESDLEFSKTADKGFAHIPYEYTEFKEDGPGEAHRGILQNFTNAVLSGEELISPGTDGIFELTLSNAAYLSSWKGHEEVQLPFDPQEFDELLAERMKGSRYLKKDALDVPTTHYYKERWNVNW